METSIEVSYTRLSLIYFTDLGKINFPTKIDYRIKLHLEKEMKILFESKKLLATGAAKPSPGAQIIFTKAPFVQYEQIWLDNNNETIMVPKKYAKNGNSQRFMTARIMKQLPKL